MMEEETIQEIFKEYEKDLERIGFPSNTDFSDVEIDDAKLLCKFIRKLNGLKSDLKIYADCKDGSRQQVIHNYNEFVKSLEE